MELLRHLNRRKAFTLAEVLITLSVIGVVAALTLPSLIQSYQKQVLVTQLKKEYSAVSRAFQKMMADEGVTNFYDTELESNWTNSSIAYKKINEYFKTLSVEYNGQTNITYQAETNNGKEDLTDTTAVNNGVKIILADGSYFRYGGKGLITFDVNGSKGPNTLNRDLFVFRVNRNGRLITGPCDQETTSGDKIIYYDIETNEACSSVFNKYENGADRIIKNGWKMDY